MKRNTAILFMALSLALPGVVNASAAAVIFNQTAATWTAIHGRVLWMQR